MKQSARRYYHIIAIFLILTGFIAGALLCDAKSAAAKKPKFDANSEF